MSHSIKKFRPIVLRRSITSPSKLAHSCRQYSSSASPLILSDTIPAPHCGCIKILSLNRPVARNAISRQLLSGLQTELSALNVYDPSCSSTKPTPDTVRALILASNVPGVFCAGADLKERITFTLDETRSFLSDLRTTFSNLSTLPIPTISAIGGAALGGGLELALATTFRLMTSNPIAKVGLPETRLAIIPGAGGTYRLPQLIGMQRAMYLILSGKLIDAHHAAQWGLVDAVVDSTGPTEIEGSVERDVLNGAIKLATDILNGGPVAINMAMKAVKGWQDGGATEGNAYEIVLGTKDRIAALTAFKNKSKPDLTGT